MLLVPFLSNFKSADLVMLIVSHSLAFSFPLLDRSQRVCVAFIFQPSFSLYKLEELRTSMRKLLPTVTAYLTEDAFPDHPTQDVATGDDSDVTQCEVVIIEDLRVGEIVQAYWEGEDEWFEGEVKDVSVEDKEFEVFYPDDGHRLWHKTEWYPVRYGNRTR